MICNNWEVPKMSINYTGDFANTTKYIERQFRKGTYGFFIDTDFGRIAVEQLTEDYDKFSPVIVLPWRDAPATNLCMMNRRMPADFYAGIGNSFSNKFPMHAHIIEAVAKVMFLSILGIVPTEDVVDAAVSVYFTEHERRQISINNMITEFLATNMDPLLRMSRTVQDMAQKIIQLRISASTKVLEEAKQLQLAYGIDHDFLECFPDVWYANIFGLMLYCIKQDPSLKITLRYRRFYGIVIDEVKSIQSIF